MTQDTQRTFAARTAALAEVFAFVDGWAQAAQLPGLPALRLRLLAEELFLNCVLHGYGGDCAQTVMLALARDGALAELLVEDAAPAFDPFASVAPPADSSDARQRPVGKLGLPLVLQLTARRSYERRGDRNRIRVALLLE